MKFPAPYFQPYEIRMQRTANFIRITCFVGTLKLEVSDELSFRRACMIHCEFMFQAIREFRVGRPQVFAGLMLLIFLVQCLWVASTRKLSDLEYRYIAAGLTGKEEAAVNPSPFTGLVAAFPVRATSVARKMVTPELSASLAVPRPWFLRLPFVIFGVWLGAALWWVARRLFDNDGGSLRWLCIALRRQ